MDRLAATNCHASQTSGNAAMIPGAPVFQRATSKPTTATPPKSQYAMATGQGLNTHSSQSAGRSTYFSMMAGLPNLSNDRPNSRPNNPANIPGNLLSDASSTFCDSALRSFRLGTARLTG